MLAINKKKGRPCKGRESQERPFLLKFTEEDYSKLEEVIKNRGISRAEFFRNAVSEAWKQDFLN